MRGRRHRRTKASTQSGASELHTPWGGAAWLGTTRAQAESTAYSQGAEALRHRDTRRYAGEGAGGADAPRHRRGRGASYKFPRGAAASPRIPRKKKSHQAY